MPNLLVTNRDGKPIVVSTAGEKDKEFTPEEISAMVLGHMRKIAETKLGCPVKVRTRWICKLADISYRMPSLRYQPTLTKRSEDLRKTR